MKGRLILQQNPQDAVTNMATDYALLTSCELPTLRIYLWYPKAVSVGRFQSLEDEIDISYCDQNGIDYVRRITGGGAVFHDSELTYSFCIQEHNDFFSPDLHESYRFICQGVIKGLNTFGLKVEYKPINDLIINGKKISGCAQTRKNNIILQHGTILMDLDIITMFRILKVPKEKISDKQISDVKQRVTSIKNLLKKKVSNEVVADALILGFERQFGIPFRQDTLTAHEMRLIDTSKSKFFANPQWTYER